jgi:hypothetical protein
MNCSKLEIVYSILLFLALNCSFLVYAHEFCYTNLILGHREVSLAFGYLAFQSFILTFILWLYFLLVFSPQRTISEYFSLEKLLSKENYDRVSMNNDSKLTNKQNKSLEKHMQRIGLHLLTRNPHGQVRVCFTCKIIKPDRAYHCKKCAKCILKRDHHCPWLNTCIGHSNQKYFILFLFYSVVYTAFMLITICVFLFNTSDSAQFSWSLRILFGLDALFFLILLFLLLNNVYLCRLNLTSIEEKFPPRVKPINVELENLRSNQSRAGIWDLGRASLNLQQVFGEDALLAFMPLWTTRGDGQVFSTDIENK